MCVYYCMAKLNRVGRSANVFILLKFLYGDNMAKQEIPGGKKDGRTIVNRHAFLA